MIAWLGQHGLALRGALRHLLQAPGSFLLNVLVIAIALALPIAGLTILENLRPVAGQLAVEPEISLFMGIDTPRERVTALASDIKRVTQDFHIAARLEFVPREKALTALKESSGLSDAIAALGKNPLPDGYILTLKNVRDSAGASRIDSFALQLKALPGVEHVQVDSAWVKRLSALLQLGRMALLLLGAILGIAVVAVAFNTIRMQVMTQQQEIEISRLFGATNAFICRPFFYTGALLGLVAGLVALGATALSLHPLNGAVAELARLYAAEFRLAPLNIGFTLGLAAFSALLGWLGALLSVRRHLARLAWN